MNNVLEAEKAGGVCNANGVPGDTRFGIPFLNKPGEY